MPAFQLLSRRKCKYYPECCVLAQLLLELVSVTQLQSLPSRRTARSRAFPCGVSAPLSGLEEDPTPHGQGPLPALQ